MAKVDRKTTEVQRLELRFEGYFGDNGQKNEGRSYDMQGKFWHEGKRTGKVVIERGNQQNRYVWYDGHIQDAQKHGSGVEYYYGGQVKARGIWKAGKLMSGIKNHQDGLPKEIGHFDAKGKLLDGHANHYNSKNGSMNIYHGPVKKGKRTGGNCILYDHEGMICYSGDLNSEEKRHGWGMSFKPKGGMNSVLKERYLEYYGEWKDDKKEGTFGLELSGEISSNPIKKFGRWENDGYVRGQNQYDEEPHPSGRRPTMQLIEDHIPKPVKNGVQAEVLE